MDLPILGIDFGNTKTCAYTYQNHHLKAILTPEGDKIIPSCVYMHDHHNFIVSKFAITNFADSEPEKWVHDSLEEVEETNCLKNYTFQVKETNRNKTLVITDGDDSIRFLPEDFITSIFKEIKRNANIYLNTNVYRAVVTLPVNFCKKQRDIISEAAQRAGFEVLKLMPDAVAAGINFMHEFPNQVSPHILVFDLGSGSFDVVIIHEQRQGYGHNKVIAVDGDINLGGRDFDNLIMNYVCDYFKQIYEIDGRFNSKWIRRLLERCKEAKEALSFYDETSIYVEPYFDFDETLEITLTRTQFERMCMKLFERTVELTVRCLKVGMVLRTAISDVVLVGGSTRIPKIQDMIKGYFEEATLRISLNFHGCSAIGAALEGVILINTGSSGVCDLKTIDVILLTIKMYDCINGLKVVFKKNTPIPCSTTFKLITLNDNQASIVFRLYEGESHTVKLNKFWGTYTITDLTLALRRTCEIITKFKVKTDGKLYITAKENFNGVRKKLKVLENNSATYWRSNFTFLKDNTTDRN